MFFYEIEGLIETVTTIPAHAPVLPFQQIKIYVDSITAPTIKRFYIYSNKTRSWIPFVSGLAGTKIYYVSDTSGGAVTRKLTFTNGVLTSET